MGNYWAMQVRFMSNMWEIHRQYIGNYQQLSIHIFFT